jgi:tRNA(Ile)-lysidine synthase
VLTAIENKEITSAEFYEVNEDGISSPISLTISSTNDNVASSDRCVVVDAVKLSFPLTLRRWQEGDVFYPVGMTGKKKLSKYFKDVKMTTREKQTQWVLCNNNDIIWVVGKRLDRRFISTENASKLQIKLT